MAVTEQITNPEIDPVIAEKQPGNRPADMPDNGPPDIGNPPIGPPGAGAPGALSTSAQPIPPPSEVAAAPKPPTTAEKVAHFIGGGQATPGSMWRGIISGALTGMVAGAGQGHFGTGMAAGGAAVQKQRQQQFENKMQLTKEQEEQKVRQATIAHLTQQTTHEAFLDTEAKQKNAQELVDSENAFNARLTEDPRNELVGHFSNMDDITKHAETNPQLAQWQAKGEIVAHAHNVPDLDKDGKPTGTFHADGVTAIHVNPDWMKQKIDKDVTVQRSDFIPNADPTKQGRWVDHTFTKGTVSNEYVEAYQMKARLEGAKYENDKVLAQANAANAKIQTDLLKLGLKREEMERQMGEYASNGQDLVEGFNDPSLLNKRSKDYWPILNAARKYSIEKYGVPFDIAKAVSDFGFAKNIGTQNTLKYMNSLTGTDNKSGNLGKIIELSNRVDRTEFPPLNDAVAWGKLQLGNDDMAALYIASTEVADQVAKILQGGQGGTSDTKLIQAQKMFTTGWTKSNMVTVGTTLRDLLGNRKTELIGDNRYLNRWFKTTVAPGGPESTAGGGGAATTGAGGRAATLPPRPPNLPPQYKELFDPKGNVGGYAIPNQKKGQEKFISLDEAQRKYGARRQPPPPKLKPGEEPPGL